MLSTFQYTQHFTIFLTIVIFWISLMTGYLKILASASAMTSAIMSFLKNIYFTLRSIFGEKKTFMYFQLLVIWH